MWKWHVFGDVIGKRLRLMFRWLLSNSDGLHCMHQLFGGLILSEYGRFTVIDLCELSFGPILGLGSISLFTMRRRLISSEYGLDGM